MIILEKVSKHYGKNYAIKNIDLNFTTKETTVIIGPSGSGKTTLLRILNNLEEPSSGTFLVDQQKLMQKDRRKLCLKVGMVFQNFNLFPHFTVGENLMYTPVNVLKLPKEQAISMAIELLTKFKLIQKFYAYPTSLSGGQKQRIAIARALMMKPEILLFDEPTSALDPENIKDVIENINLLKTQMSMVVVTHHLKFAKLIADRIIFMDQGQILANQPANEFFKKPASHRARLFLENIGDLM
ncbi:amino acid ABC transporter ATP-binding protein [Rickettsia prowazekii]|uniref:GLUTAMINE TRANSPORT ATP-BINDING PROTEIN GLNQ (GlnQ2) n=2 Tax=Rickettsia prowazekii TaxID=782 RepID=Q9ZC98_RICPR|nr:amino acid ABC transporter ATP-binding protein [Rickettsia prowazekii]ADE30449.1 Glutamine ABC transporter ATP-binding protein [Rickettsia prowazekii str. Rp22]AFE49662.1 glutamine ABC transporter ATP-binding protein [Rickettsia prowazekii str. Chernikova]AFE50506.1 glutamine ABC transporter ATP-binding protein [Rickettsia prowazekii str. Katsinyian]AFE51349.1 glutamine ABC transporter ATP-binding protein [Rickettsia prowazekii str. BuV67-CWPP]AFE52187.1 glutamine ABC transporter ATP-bindin